MINNEQNVSLDNKSIKKAMNKFGGISEGAVKELTDIKLEVRDIHDNQAQIIPALISIWDAIKHLQERTDYNTYLLTKLVRESKLSYDEFLEKEPKPHIEMKLE